MNLNLAAPAFLYPPKGYKILYKCSKAISDRNPVQKHPLPMCIKCLIRNFEPDPKLSQWSRSQSLVAFELGP